MHCGVSQDLDLAAYCLHSTVDGALSCVRVGFASAVRYVGVLPGDYTKIVVRNEGVCALLRDGRVRCFPAQDREALDQGTPSFAGNVIGSLTEYR
jgi:hypothetical protein